MAEDSVPESEVGMGGPKTITAAAIVGTALGFAPQHLVPAPALACKVGSAWNDDPIAAGRDALRRARDVYGKAKTLTGVSRSFDWSLAPGDDTKRELTPRATVRFDFESPRKLSARSGETGSRREVVLTTDGRTMWSCVARIGQYKAEPIRPDFDLDSVGGEDEPYLAELLIPPVPQLWRGVQTPELFLRLLQDVSGSSPQIREGKPGLRVFGLGKFGAAAEGSPATNIEIWVDDASGLVGEVVIDLTAAVGVAFPAATARRGVLVRIDDQVLDGPVDSSVFAFTPPVSARPVSRFVPPATGGAEPFLLIGEKAPLFQSEGLDGARYSLDGLRGRVVVLDFWATWCAPCIAAMPDLQKMADRFADKPVTFIGINRDRAMQRDVLRLWLSTRNISFAQVLDESADISMDYRVSGIPHTVVIDQDGRIATVQIGNSLGTFERLEEAVGRLLRGEAVHSPEQLRRLRQEDR